MIDLHTHSVFSDGELIPSEIIRRMEALGNKGVAITDHADFTTIPLIMRNLRKMQEYRDEYDLKVLFGVEITHVPPNAIGKAVELALKEGAEIILVHGETISEPVKEGTNLAAVEEEIDILAHPGLINEKIAELAKSNGVYLEVTARRGHCLTNGHIINMSKIYGFRVVVTSDAHAPSDFINEAFARKILLGAGEKDTEKILQNSAKLMQKKLKKL